MLTAETGVSCCRKPSTCPPSLSRYSKKFEHTWFGERRWGRTWKEEKVGKMVPKPQTRIWSWDGVGTGHQRTLLGVHSCTWHLQKFRLKATYHEHVYCNWKSLYHVQEVLDYLQSVKNHCRSSVTSSACSDLIKTIGLELVEKEEKVLTFIFQWRVWDGSEGIYWSL